jgi:hypothetical protein
MNLAVRGPCSYSRGSSPLSLEEVDAAPVLLDLRLRVLRVLRVCSSAGRYPIVRSAYPMATSRWLGLRLLWSPLL